MRALEGFSMYTRPHVRFSIHAACLVLQESLQSIVMLRLVVSGWLKCVICGSVGSFNMLHETLCCFLFSFKGVFS